MSRWFLTIALALGYFGSVQAQDEAPPQNSGPVQSRPEAKGKKAVPERGSKETENFFGVSVSADKKKDQNPMLTLGQVKVAKKEEVKPAGEPEKKTKPANEGKNAAMLGFGFNSTSGVQIHVEVKKDDTKRMCMMSLPNLFFCIPACIREPEKKEEKTPISIDQAHFPVKFLRESEFFRSVEDQIGLIGTQYLGMVEVDNNPFGR